MPLTGGSWWGSERVHWFKSSSSSLEGSSPKHQKKNPFSLLEFSQQTWNLQRRCTRQVYTGQHYHNDVKMPVTHTHGYERGRGRGRGQWGSAGGRRLLVARSVCVAGNARTVGKRRHGGRGSRARRCCCESMVAGLNSAFTHSNES
jgi:hypothetical protein